MANKARWERTLPLWASSFRLAYSQDGRSWAEMRKVLEWSQRDDFWASNIMSGKTFRKQYEQLRAKMNQPDKPQRKAEPNCELPWLEVGE